MWDINKINARGSLVNYYNILLVFCLWCTPIYLLLSDNNNIKLCKCTTVLSCMKDVDFV